MSGAGGNPAPGADQILSALLDHFSALGITLYPAQEEAIFALLDNQHVVLSTPTGSGKSLVATALLYKALCEGQTGVYTCPVKALVNEKFFDLCAVFGAERVGLSTGDAQVNPGAPIMCATAEILANQTIRRSAAPPHVVVMDEFHYYADEERGMAWQIPLVDLPATQFLLMSATLGDVSPIMEHLRRRSGRAAVQISGMQRPVPLYFDYRDSALHETVLDLVRDNRAPIYLVNFTQRACAEQAQNLTSIELCDKEGKAAIKQALRGERFASPYGKEVQKLLHHGIGLHHAGLLPRYRRLCERLAQRGLLKVVSGTDTLGVGVNIPIRTVLFTQLCKYDGSKDTILPVREFHQIAGRAGRKGFDDAGYVVAQAPAHTIENKKLAAKGKKFVKRQPPGKGYVHFDKGTFDRLVAGAPEPLVSRFSISHGFLLSALQAEGSDPRRGAGYRRAVEIIAGSHEADTRKSRHRRTAAACFRVLRKLGLVTLTRDDKARNPYPVPSAELQRSFSLNQTLAPYLVETLPQLDPTTETYPYDALSLCEAILENPRAIVLAQQDREKGVLVAALKAEGVEYEQRMEELEKVEWPKPNRDFIYASFNAWSEHHPWVGQDNIAPKGVARELLEHRSSFAEYVRDLGVARSEGVLLRYLSDVCRLLSRGVPTRFLTPALEDLALDLEATVRIVDASLLEEWRALTSPTQDPTPNLSRSAGEVASPDGRRPASEAGEGRALNARIRGEFHRLLAALIHKDWDEALESILPDDETGTPWTRERLAAELAPVFTALGGLNATPAARAPLHTVVKPIGPHRWEATQRLLGAGRAAVIIPAVGSVPEPAPGSDQGDHDDHDQALHALIDLSPTARASLPHDAPVLTLRRIGT